MSGTCGPDAKLDPYNEQKEMSTLEKGSENGWYDIAECRFDKGGVFL